MVKAVINRLWHGKSSVRDYIVKEAQHKGEDLLIELKETGEQMLIKHPNTYRGKWNPKEIKSIHDTKPYHLVDFKWKPNFRQKKLL